MRKRPKGSRYRNLTTRGGVIYYQKRVDGQRVRFSTETSDWDEAAAVRDEYEQAKRATRGSRPRHLLFSDFAQRYLEEATAHLARTTRRGRELLLRPAGRLTSHFGEFPINEIGRPALMEWWNAEVEGRGRSTRTGKDYLDALSGVFGFAIDLEELESNPADAFRATLRRRSRTKRGRAEAAAGAQISPIEPPEAIDQVLEAAADEGEVAYLWVLLQLDAGLRTGEAEGLRWNRIAWGSDADDTDRHLIVDRNRPRGGPAEETKSGRTRRVALSLRLRAALLERYVAIGQPDGEEEVLPRYDRSNFRKRGWKRIVHRAGLAGVKAKDLRDSFASYLLTCGVQLGYVSRQLGHSNVATTANHYARWAGDDSYRAPLTLEPGEVPADLLARLNDPTSDPTSIPPSLRYPGIPNAIEQMDGGPSRTRTWDRPVMSRGSGLDPSGTVGVPGPECAAL